MPHNQPVNLEASTAKIQPTTQTRDYLNHLLN